MRHKPFRIVISAFLALSLGALVGCMDNEDGMLALEFDVGPDVYRKVEIRVDHLLVEEAQMPISLLRIPARAGDVTVTCTFRGSEPRIHGFESRDVEVISGQVVHVAVPIPTPTRTSVTIAIAVDLSGDWKLYGNLAAEGALVAARQLEEQGIPLDLELLFLDTKSSPNAAAAVISNLPGRVIGVVGPLTSSSAAAVNTAVGTTPIGDVPSILLPVSTKVEGIVTVGGPLVRIGWSDSAAAHAAAALGRELRGEAGAAIVYAPGNPYSRASRKYFQAAWPRTIRMTSEYPDDAEDPAQDHSFMATALRIKSLNIGVVWCPGYAYGVARLCRDLARVGADVVLLTGDGADPGVISEIAPDADIPVYGVAHYHREASTNRHSNGFAQIYSDEYPGSDISGITANAGDAVTVLAHALMAIDSDVEPSRAAVHEAVLRTRSFAANGFIERIIANEAVRDVHIVRYREGGHWDFVKSVTPPARR